MDGIIMEIRNNIFYVGVNDHNIDLFEGQYMVENGMAYNSYIIMDKKIAIMDTVDKNFTHEWLDNIANTIWGYNSLFSNSRYLLIILFASLFDKEGIRNVCNEW